MPACRRRRERSPAVRVERHPPPRAAESPTCLFPPPLRGRVRVGGRNQHAVAKAIKAVALPDRLRVGGENSLPAREGADQHQQRALREMEVRDHRIDNPEPVPGKDQEARPTLTGSHTLAGCRALQRAHGRGTYGYHPLTMPARFVDRPRRGPVDPEPFTVNWVL